MVNSEIKNLWSKDFVIIMLASAGIMFCNFFFLSTLPIYAQKMTGTAAYAGLMTTVYTFAALIIRPICGIMSDKLGRTKLLIMGALLCCIACTLYNFANVLILLILIRALQGIGFGIHTTCGGAVAADVIPKSRLAQGMSYYGLFSTIAVALAPGIALSIIGNGDAQNFRILFILAAVITFVSMILDCFITYERKNKKAFKSETLSKIPTNSDNENLPKTFLGFEYGVFIPSVVVILLHVALSSVTSFIALFALDRNLGNIGLFFTLNATGVFLSRLFFGKVADKRGADIIVIPGLIVFAICIVLIPFVNSLVYLLLIAFPLGLAQGAVTPVMNTMMFQRCSAERRGTASAAYFASIDIGYGIGSVIYGLIAAGLGYYFVYGVATFFTVLSIITYLLAIAKRKGQIPVKSIEI